MGGTSSRSSCCDRGWWKSLHCEGKGYNEGALGAWKFCPSPIPVEASCDNGPDTSWRQGDPSHHGFWNEHQERLVSASAEHRKLEDSVANATASKNCCSNSVAQDSRAAERTTLTKALDKGMERGV